MWTYVYILSPNASPSREGHTSTNARVLVYSYEREALPLYYIYLLVNFKKRDVHILSFNNADRANRVIRLSIPRYDYNRTLLFPA